MYKDRFQIVARLGFSFMQAVLLSVCGVAVRADEPNAAISAIKLNKSQILERARASSTNTDKTFRSAKCVASFEVSLQRPGEQKPTIRTKGHYIALYSDEKYFVSFDYEGRGEGDRRVILADGNGVHVVEFSRRIQPVGCSVDTYSDMREACTMARFPFRDPVRLWKEIDLRSTWDNLGPDALTMEPNGTSVVGKCQAKNSEVVSEFLLTPETQFRPAVWKKFNPAHVLAVSVNAEWKESASVWYVNRLEKVDDFRNVKNNGRWSRSVCEFSSFTPNVSFEADQFTLRVVNIPPGARHLDRRKPDRTAQPK
jgi:hypothetical protein